MRNTITIILAIILLTALAPPQVYATNEDTLDATVKAAAAYVLRTVKNPVVDSVGGEWAVIGLARSGYEVPSSYFDKRD